MFVWKNGFDCLIFIVYSLHGSLGWKIMFLSLRKAKPAVASSAPHILQFFLPSVRKMKAHCSGCGFSNKALTYSQNVTTTTELMWLVDMLLGQTCFFFFLCVLTLQCWRPPQSFACGCWGSGSRSQRIQGKNCAPGHKMPCRYSSWMKNSEYPHAEGEDKFQISDGKIPKVGKYYLSLSCLNHQVQLQLHWLTLQMSTKHTMGCHGRLAHLIRAGLGTAPVE